MPHDKFEAGSPRDWLRYAESDLELAKTRPSPRVLLETLCFHAQQTVEKSLKGVLVFFNEPFPYTHDIARLITLIKRIKADWPDRLDEAAALSEYAAGLRYPGDLEEITQEEYEEAIQLAEAVLEWAKERIENEESD